MAKTVLIVDDEQAIRQMMGKALANAGLTAIEARSGEEALELLRKRQVDVALVDLMLEFGGIDGLTLGEIVSEEFPDTVLLAVTGFSHLFERHELTEAGFRDVYSKPFDVRQLITAIQQDADAGYQENGRDNVNVRSAEPYQPGAA